MADDPIDRHLADLRQLAEAAAASVRPIDPIAHETALVREALEQLHRERATPAKGIDWERIRRMAERHRR